MKPSQRFDKKKKIRLPSGKIAIHIVKEKKYKPRSPISGDLLQACSSSNKLSKTEKRPSVLFGGVLSSRDRDFVFEEAIKVAVGYKKIEDVPFNIKNFVEQALTHVEYKGGK